MTKQEKMELLNNLITKELLDETNFFIWEDSEEKTYIRGIVALLYVPDYDEPINSIDISEIIPDIDPNFKYSGSACFVLRRKAFYRELVPEIHKAIREYAESKKQIFKG